MAIKVARGQVTIIDQNDAVSLQAFIGSSQPLTQVFNKDTGAYAPSWAASPYLILTPSLFVSGKAAVDQISSVGNAATLTAGVKSGSAKWYKDGTVITSGQDSCTIGAASAKYALTVKANHMTVSAPQVRYTFEAIYIDANGLEIPFRAEVQFTQHLNAGAMIAAVAYAPDGIVFKNDEVATLKAHCDLWRGATIDTTNVTYAWGIKDSAVFANTTLTAEAKTGATTVTVASVTNMEAGGKISIGSVQYTISAVSASTKVVTLTSALTGTSASGSPVSCPYYNAMLGAGWACLTSANPRGVTAGWTTNEITITADIQMRHQGYGYISGQQFGKQGGLRYHLVHGHVGPHHGGSCQPERVHDKEQRQRCRCQGGTVPQRRGTGCERHSLYLYMEIVELGRNIGHKDLYGKIHHRIESGCDRQGRTHVRGIEII